jgi:hypothetical protein
MSPDAAEAAWLAQNLARNCGYAVFPCRFFEVGGKVRKLPTRPKREGGNGFHDATADPDKIAWLWQNWPGPLIGVATGQTSNTVLLDVDTDHDEARAWYHANRSRLPLTRTFRSYSGGVHLHYLYTTGIGTIAGKPVPGVDVRGDGGMMIYWFAYGLACLDHSPPAPWPTWLTSFFWPPKPKPSPAAIKRFDAHPDRAIERALDRIASTPTGNRNEELNKRAWQIGLRVAKGQISRAEAEARLEAAALRSGMTDKEDGILRTIRSGLESALR